MLGHKIHRIIKFTIVLLLLLCLVDFSARAQAANNACTGTEDISDQAWHNGDNTLANYDCAADINTTNCNTPYQTTNMCCGIEGVESSLWYSFTVPTDQVIYIDFQSIVCSPVSLGGVNTALQGFLLVDVGCVSADLSVIKACFSANNANNVNGQMSINAVGGQLYRIMIDTKKNTFTSCGSGCIKANNCHSNCTFQIRLRTNTPTIIKDFNVRAGDEAVYCDWFYDFQENYSHFRIERKNQWTGTKVIINEAPVESFTHEGYNFHFRDYTVGENGQYTYILYGSNDGENYEGIASRTVSVQNIQQADALIIPNPADEQIEIVLQNTGNASALCEIYSSLGVPVSKFIIDERDRFTTLNTSDLAPGIYYVKVIIGNKIINKKLSLY